MSTTFTEQQYELCYPLGIDHHWWTLARNRLLAEVIRSHCPEGAELLEVGCGRGVVVRYLYEHGLAVRGVELADIPCLEGTESYVRTGTDAMDLPLEERESVHGLLFLDVIEHLEEPESFLDSLQQHFPNLSIVILTVPTRQEIWSNYDEFYGHYRRYTLEMLEDLARTQSWEIVKAGYFFRLPYAPARLMSLLDVDRGTTILPPSERTRPLHRLVAMLCGWEQKILPGSWRGTSAYAVYRI